MADEQEILRRYTYGETVDGKKKILRMDGGGNLQVGGARITLRTNLNGTASWSKVGDNNSQLRYSDWTALLNGGEQHGSDWAAVHIPIDDLPVPEFKEFIYKYYLEDAQVAGLTVCLATYNPNDHTERAEISQTAGVPPSEEEWNFYTINPDTPDMFWYGNGVTSDLVEGVGYTWAQFQADKAFKNHVIYMIKLEQGYWGEGTTAGDCWVSGVKLNGVDIPIEPSLNEQLDMIREATVLAGTLSMSVIEHHTADDTLTIQESHTTHTNLGAGDTVALTLPQDAATGCRFRFVVMVAKELQIAPGLAGAIYLGGEKQLDNKYICADAIAESVELVCDGNHDWVAIGAVGDWEVEA